MTSPISRRGFLGASAAGGLGIAIAGSLEAIAGPAFAGSRSPQGYGPLVPDPAGLLALPAGFSYRIVAEAGRDHAGVGSAHAERRRRHGVLPRPPRLRRW